MLALSAALPAAASSPARLSALFAAFAAFLPAALSAALPSGCSAATAAALRLYGHGLPADGGPRVQRRRGFRYCNVRPHLQLGRLSSHKHVLALRLLGPVQRRHIELGHLQRHRHGENVLCALRACPVSSLRSWPPPARCLRGCRYSTPSRLPARTSPLLLCFSFDLAGGVGVQPAAELQRLQRHNHGVHVFGALRACPASKPRRLVLPARCLRRSRRRRPSRLLAHISHLFQCFPLHSAERKQFVKREQAPHPLCMVGQCRV